MRATTRRDGCCNASGDDTNHSCNQADGKPGSSYCGALFVSFLERMGLLEHGRSVTFLYVVLNAGVQVLVFLISLHKIIDNYYVDFKDQHPLDFAFHHLCFILHVLCETLITGFAVWLATHVVWAVVYRFHVLLLRPILQTRPDPAGRKNPNRSAANIEEAEANGDATPEIVEDGKAVHARKHKGAPEIRKKSPTTAHQHHRGSINAGRNPSSTLFSTVLSHVHRVWKWISPHEILLLAVIETVLFSVCVLESRLLADMSVHFIDLDLVELLGLKSVLQRQHSLGAGLAEEHWKYIYLIIALLFVVQAGIYLLSRYLDGRLPKRRKYKLLLFFLVLGVALLLFVPYEHKVLVERQNHFRSQLPFNFFDHEANKGLIPVYSKTSTTFPPVLGEGYPVIPENVGADAVGDAFPAVGRRRNIVVIVQESFRMYELQPSHSPRLHAFSEAHQCIQPQTNIAPGHVSELSWFAILYGLHPYHYHTFGLGHVLSYPLEVLKRNGYVTALMSASTCWPYPNANLFDNFQEFDSVEHNGDLMVSIDNFVKRRTEDKKNYFTYIMMHKSVEEYKDITSLDPERQKNRDLLKDRDRMVVIDKLNRSGLLEDAVVFFLSDHGDMLGEHGELGHGQKEGSWWNEKAMVPFFACLLGKGATESSQYNRHPTLTTLTDVTPSYMSLLNLNPPLDAATYGNGMSVFLPKTAADPTVNRTVICNARYFPKKNKINAVIDPTHKMWFRVNHFEEDTKEMRFYPELVTDMRDEQPADCSLATIRAKFDQFAARERDAKRVGMGEGEKGEIVMTTATGAELDDACHSARFWRYIRKFDAEFWRFVRLNQKR